MLSTYYLEDTNGKIWKKKIENNLNATPLFKGTLISETGSQITKASEPTVGVELGGGEVLSMEQAFAVFQMRTLVL